jgi:hypothetical protein
MSYVRKVLHFRHGMASQFVGLGRAEPSGERSAAQAEPPSGGFRQLS